MTRANTLRELWMADTERAILASRPDAAGRIQWHELAYLRQCGRSSASAAASYLERHDELVKSLPAPQWR